MIITIESNAHCYRIPKGKEARAVSISADDEVEGWATIFLSIVVGLLALWFFLAMGGIFALVGPWMIFTSIHLVRKVGRHLSQQALQLVASIGIHATICKILHRNKRALFTQCA